MNNFLQDRWAFLITVSENVLVHIGLYTLQFYPNHTKAEKGFPGPWGSKQVS